mmetsp:Transcript_19543/g.35463  ORF Transcript_19543/g.35463 Transcript_19543/m.35463 type:complete len:402 (+) Transcript_19543:444-1649(+)
MSSSRVGSNVGKKVGMVVGYNVGENDGEVVGVVAVGVSVGAMVGVMVGVMVGLTVGNTVGSCVGISVGVSVGSCVGNSVGVLEGSCVGVSVGNSVGISVGTSVGNPVGTSVPKTSTLTTAVPHTPLSSHALYRHRSCPAKKSPSLLPLPLPLRGGGVYRTLRRLPEMSHRPPMREGCPPGLMEVTSSSESSESAEADDSNSIWAGVNVESFSSFGSSRFFSFLGGFLAMTSDVCPLAGFFFPSFFFCCFLFMGSTTTTTSTSPSTDGFFFFLLSARPISLSLPSISKSPPSSDRSASDSSLRLSALLARMSVTLSDPPPMATLSLSRTLMLTLPSNMVDAESPRITGLRAGSRDGFCARTTAEMDRTVATVDERYFMMIRSIRVRLLACWLTRLIWCSIDV